MLKRMRSFLVAAMLMVIATVSAQVTTSSMSGKVTAQDEPIIGATVVAIHEPSGTRYGTVTNISGQFNLQGMRTGGPYKVEVSYVGYQTAIYKGVNLSLGEVYTLNVVLKESSELLDEVIVTAQKTVEKMGTVTNVSERQLTTLPTINRSITDFTKLSPYAGGSNSFAGRDGRYNTITVDGAALNNNFGLSTNNLPGGDAQPISLDAIDEISVNVSPYSVTYSNFTGASINAVTKSGTNELKGTVYTYQKPKNFIGKSINDVDVPNVESYKSSLYGFTLGAPIIKNKLFFFVNGELENSTSPGILWTPSQEEGGSGDNQNHISRTWIKDLKTISDFVKDKYGYDPGSYDKFDDFESKNWKLMARLDWNINKSHKLSLRFNTVKSENDASISSTSSVITKANSNRYGVDAFAFGNSNYGFRNIVTSLSGELNSNFSSSVQNKLLVTYTHIRDSRTTKGDAFPMVDIYKDGKQYMTLGTELFTPFNDVENNVFSVTDNVTINKGNHLITAGATFERQYFMNSYLRAPYRYYRYASMDDFMTGEKPMLYGITYGYNGKDAPGAELTFGMLGAYAQDEYSITPILKLTYGLRFDLPLYFDDLLGNAAIKEQSFNGTNVDVSEWPKSKLLISPRLGFNWDIKGDRSIVLTGGTGLFTGLLPFVWFTNQPTNAGQMQNMVEFETSELPANFAFNPNYKETLTQNPDMFPSTPGNEVPGAIAYVDPNFKMPQVWRSNVNAEFQLPYGFMLSVGAMYTRDIYNVVQKNMNEKAPSGTYNEQPGRVYWTKNNYYDNPKTKTVIQLTNGDEKGYQYSFNAVLTKKFDFGFTGSFGYTYTMAKDMTANPGSSAASVWQNNVAVNSLNDPGVSYSLFSTPHRLIANASYEVAYANMKTTVSLFYTGYQQGRFSYTYSNDMNGDGNYSDLMYVPASKEEMTFVDIKDKQNNVTYSAVDQQEDFWNYVNNDSYLNDHKGQYVERASSLEPWIHRFDMKIAQDFYAKIGSRKYGIQVSLDMLNIGNLLNSKWGAYRSCGLQSYDNVRLLKTASKVGEPLTYQMNASSREVFQKNSKWDYTASTGSAWQMQLGVKFTF